MSKKAAILTGVGLGYLLWGGGITAFGLWAGGIFDKNNGKGTTGNIFPYEFLETNEKGKNTSVLDVNENNIKDFILNKDALNGINIEFMDPNVEDGYIDLYLDGYDNPVRVGYFLSQNEVDIDNFIKDLETKPFEITDLGKTVLASQANKDKANLSKYINNLPVDNNGVKVELKEIVVNDDNGSLVLTYTFKKGVREQTKTFNPVEGFKTMEQAKEEFFNKVSNLTVEAIQPIASQTLVTKVDKTNASTYITIPVSTDEYNVEIITIRPLDDTKNNKKIYLEIKYINNEIDYNVTKEYEVDGFKSKNEAIDEQIDDIINSINPTINDLGKNTLVKDVDENNIKDFVDGLPESSYNDLGLTTEISIFKPTDDNGQITVTVTYKKDGNEYASKDYPISGFKTEAQNAKEIFDQKVKDVKLSSKQPEASQIKASDVLKDEVAKYVNGIPASTVDFQVSVVEVRPKTNDVNNDILIVKLKFENPNFSACVAEKEYEVDGFMSQRTEDKKVVENAINNFNNLNLTVTQLGSQTLITDVNKDKDNLSQYVDGLPANPDSDGVSFTIVEVQETSTDGTAKIILQFTKGAYTSQNIEKEVSGFKTKDQQNKEDFDKLVGSIVVDAIQPIASQTLVSLVNSNNASTYINIPKETDKYTVEVLVCEPLNSNKDNTKINLQIKFTSKEISNYSKTLNYEVDGFKSKDQATDDDIQNIIQSINPTINDEGRKVIIVHVTQDNIRDYVDGIPNASYDDLGLTTELSWTKDAISTDEMNLTIVMKKDGNEIFNKEFRVVGFKSEYTYANEVLDEFIANVSLTTTDQAQNIRPNGVNSDNLPTYVDGLPVTNELVEVMEINVSTSTKSDTAIVISIKYGFIIKPEFSIQHKNRPTKTSEYELDGFMSQDSFDQVQVDDAINQFGINTKLTANADGQNKLVSEVTVDNIKSLVNEELPKDSYDNAVTTSIKEIKLAADSSSAGTLKVVVTFTKGNVSRDIEIDASGFKTTAQNDKEIFDQKVANVSLSAKPEAANQLVSQVNTSNVETFVDGIPTSTDDFKVTIVEVKPKDPNDSANTTLVVKLKFENPNYPNDNNYIVEQTYEVNGFLSQDASDLNDINDLIPTLNINAIANDDGQITLVKDLTTDNIYSKTTGLPEKQYDGGITTEVKSVEAIQNEDGSVNVTITFKKGTQSVDQTYKVTGFKTKNQEAQDELNNFIQQYVPTTNVQTAPTIRPSGVTDDNLSQYVNNLPPKDDAKVEVTFEVSADPNSDTSIKLIIHYQHKEVSTIKRDETYTLDGFMSQSKEDQDDVDNAETEFNKLTLTVTQKGSETLIADVNTDKNNLSQYVDGLPANPDTNGVSFTIDEVQETSTDGTAKIIITFTKGSASKTVEKEVSGFKTKESRDKEIFDQAVGNVNLTRKDVGGDVPIDWVNISNVETYVDGIPTSTDDFKVTIVEVRPESDDINNENLIVKLKFENPNYQGNQNFSIEKEYTISGFMSKYSTAFSDVKDFINQYKPETNIQTAPTIRPSDVTVNNLSQYVNNLPPTNDENVKVEIISVNPSPDNDTSIVIVIRYDHKKIPLTKPIEKSWTLDGFKSKDTADNDDVNHAIDEFNKLTLTVTQKGSETLIADVNTDKNNLSQYVDGLPANPDTNGVSFTIDEVQETSTDGTAKIIITFTKGSASKIVEKEVSGFKTKAQDAFEKAVEDNKNNIDINDLGRQTLVSLVNKNNVKNYVTGLDDTDKYTINIQMVMSDPAPTNDSITLKVEYTSKEDTTKTISKEYTINGFLSQDASDLKDINDLIPTLNINATANADGQITLVKDLTTDNIYSKTTGLPEKQYDDGITTEVKSVEAINGEDGSVNVTITFKKGTQSVDQTYKVTGFKTENQQAQDELNNFIQTHIPETNNQTAPSVRPDAVTADNLSQYVNNLPPKDDAKVEVTWEVAPSTSKDNAIVVTINYQHKTVTSVHETRTYELEGFKTQEQLDKELVDQATNNAQNLTLSTTNLGKATLITAVNADKDNLSKYVSGLPANPDSNGVSFDVIEVRENNQDGNAIIILQFKKGIQVSNNNVELECNGFKTRRAQAKEDVVAFVNNVNMSEKPNVSNVMPSQVSSSNISDFINSVPESTTSIEVIINSIVPDDRAGSMEVSITYKHKEFSNDSDITITKTYPFDGFKNLRADMKEEADQVGVWFSNAIWSPNDLGKATQVAKLPKDDNFKDYISGSGVDKIGDTVQMTKYTFNINIVDIDESKKDEGIAFVKLRISCNGENFDYVKSVKGFKLPNEQIKKMLKDLVNEYGSKNYYGNSSILTSDAKQNIRQYVNGLPPEQDPNGVWTSEIEFAGEDMYNGTLDIVIIFRADGEEERTIPLTVTGFKQP